MSTNILEQYLKELENGNNFSTLNGMFILKLAQLEHDAIETIQQKQIYCPGKYFILNLDGTIEYFTNFENALDRSLDLQLNFANTKYKYYTFTPNRVGKQIYLGAHSNKIDCNNSIENQQTQIMNNTIKSNEIYNSELDETVDHNINIPHTFILVDGSYYTFYRYNALIKWWMHSHSSNDTTIKQTHIDFIQEDEFIDKFKEVFVNKLKEIPKKLKIHKDNPFLIIGKDCKREEIWRKLLFKEYKENRDTNNNIGKFFSIAYDDNLFTKGGAQTIVHHPKLEADDCIALSVKFLTKKYPFCKIYIITSDNDYLQLKSQNVELYNLTYKKLSDSKNATGNAEFDLKLKIIMGDKSDNIPPVIPRCGIKTAQRYINNTAEFNELLENNESYKQQYQLNKTLIDFNNIPQILIDEFMQSLSI